MTSASAKKGSLFAIREKQRKSKQKRRCITRLKMIIAWILVYLQSFLILSYAQDMDLEKAWLPWPSSLIDPNKAYTTTTLNPILETTTDLTTLTVRVTKTVLSYSTVTTSIPIERYSTHSTTSTTETTLTNTLTSIITEFSTITLSFDSTITTSLTARSELGDVGAVDQDAVRRAFEAEGYPSANISFLTHTINLLPTVTSTTTRTNKVNSKIIETILLTGTLTATRPTTIISTERVTETSTSWTTSISYVSITRARSR